MERHELERIIRDVLAARLGGGSPAADGAPVPGPGPVTAPATARPAASARGDLRTRRGLVTEAEVLAARASGQLIVSPGSIVTPLARESADRYGVALVPPGPATFAAPDPAPAPSVAADQPLPSAPGVTLGVTPGGAAACGVPAAETVALGADHGGFPLKQALKRFLAEEAGYRVLDCGTDSDASVDYPDFAHKVAGAVSRGEARWGLMIDGVGVGSAMAANRHPGVRAASGSGILEVVNAREHNDANVLCLGGRIVGDLLARALAMTFLTTAFAGGRHARRVAKIEGGAR